MEGRSLAVLATLDTKAGEAAYLRDAIEKDGRAATVVDVGLGEASKGLADVTAQVVAFAAGTSVDELRAEGRRDKAMEAMGTGAGKLLLEEHQAGRLAGVVPVGGNQGTAIASFAMQALTIGPSKLIISTVASGDVRDYVADSDIVMMFSIGDLLGGPNPVTRRILDKGSAAGVGMARAEEASAVADETEAVSVTAFGNTHQAVVTAMERLVEEGLIEGVLDLTTHELLGELFPEDIYTPVRPGRLTAAGRGGIPQVIAPGGLEYFCFGAPETIPSRLRDRATHYHNPYNTNVRANREELWRVGELMAERLNASHGSVSVLIPTLGWSEVGSPGGILHDPDANLGLVEALRERLDPAISLREVDAAINDDDFARLAAETLLELMDAQTYDRQDGSTAANAGESSISRIIELRRESNAD